MAEFTRSTFHPAKSFSTVLHEAGRLVIESDLNEAQKIAIHDQRQSRIDIIGRSGTPEGNPGFAISIADGQVRIGAGRYYLDGIRIDWPEELDYEAQQHGPTLPAAAGLYVALLHVWERPVDAISDPQIREVALGGPTTSVRLEVVAQVELLRVTSESADPSCATQFQELEGLLSAEPPRMQVRLAEGVSDDPCSIPEDAGYRGLENQLYRIEIHEGNFDPTRPDEVNASISPTFKWSRDNGSVVASWTAYDGGVVLGVDRLGPGGTHGFVPGDRIEITHDEWLLSERPGVSACIAEVGSTTLTLEDAGGTLAAELSAAFAPELRPRVQRWDSPSVRALAVLPGELGTGDVTADGWIRLEAGIEVRFEPGVARTGMYWELPARTAALPGTDDRQLDWPVDEATGEYAMRRPDGIEHHYGQLAVLHRSGAGGWSVLDDCRPQFPPLTDLPDSVLGDGCGEIGIAPDSDLVSALVSRGIAALDASGALVPGAAGDTLALCFRPGAHAVGNLAFARWRSLTVSALDSNAVTLHGRIRARSCAQVRLKDISVIDLNMEGGPIPAVDDAADVEHRWRTRAIEVRDSTDVTIERCSVEFRDPRWRLKDGQAIHVSDARDARVRDCIIRVPRGQNGIRMQDVQRAVVEGNRLLQDWAQPILLDSLTSLERRELGAWVGRLLIDFGSIHNRSGRRVDFVTLEDSSAFDRRPFRVGVGSSDERYWAARSTALGFAASGLTGNLTSVRDRLASESASMMKQLYSALALHSVLPSGASTAPGDLVTVRRELQRLWHRRRAALGTRLIRGAEVPRWLIPMRDRMITQGRWELGLGGTAIRVAVPVSAQGAISVSCNWVENFAVGIQATWHQAGDAIPQDIQRIDICGNSLRLRSPLLPVQRGGIIAGGAQRVRVDDNDIDVREGSSGGIDRNRGWFMGVDGIVIRGRVGSWVGARGNRVHGCAVGLRSRHLRQSDSLDSAPAVVEAFRDNAFVGCDFHVA